MNRQSRKIIGVLTLRLLVNYGGVLQNAALHKVLYKLGFFPVTIPYSHPMHLNTWALESGGGMMRLAYKIGLLRFLTILQDNTPGWLRGLRWLGIDSLRMAGRGHLIRRFIKKHICMSHYCGCPINARDVARIGAWAYVVGSDQVWRYSMSRDKRPFFCHFLPREVRSRCISYAASFGVSHWDWPDDMTRECAKLAPEFRAHSVREEDGVDLCRKYLGVDAKWLPDPTFLLTRDEWNALRGNVSYDSQSPYIAYYILDMTPQKQVYLEKLAAKMRCRLVNCKYDASLSSDVEKDAVPDFRSVEEWLKVIEDASCMITDSFHGMVFSVIYNVPFLCFGNEGRGSARFSSLCRKLNLHHCMMSEQDIVSVRIPYVSPEEWNCLNAEVSAWREEGYAYMVSNLKEGDEE